MIILRRSAFAELRMIISLRIKRKALESKTPQFIIAAFGICMVAHAVGGYFLGPNLAKIFPEIPQLTMSMLASSSLSPLIALFYIGFATKFIPRLNIKRELLTYIPAGIIMVWITVFLSVLILGKEIPLAKNILKTPRPYYYLNLFMLIAWGPLLEETLYRGYFFELLKRVWGNRWAFLFSSFLFVLFHGIWGGFGIGLFFVFFYSAIFTLLYIEGGLVASIMVHSFCNFYLMYMNMS